ncbi:ferric reductase-like transmembrane domain-containing protein [Cohnella thermotolerans]|uniref:ferric reductase-like transmembrane domain-containing protein n=1 Tax=Cohnella thermotolerans TaxID=329858 RepID=UPI00041A6B7E|nr:ferric reductase-like transmembrane domain-containing protein [Cohnella thermotolerans]
MHALSDWLTVWATTRAAGMTSYLLLFASTVAGLLTSGRLAGKKRKAALLAAHQWTGWFGFLFGALHGMVLVFDRYVGYSPFELLVPFASDDHRLLTGLGTLTFYISALLILSSDLIKQWGKRVWRAIHFLAFAGFGMALLHGFALGTDTRDGGVKTLYIVTGIVVAGLTVYRIYDSRRQRQAQTVAYIPPAPHPARMERFR